MGMGSHPYLNYRVWKRVYILYGCFWLDVKLCATQQYFIWYRVPLKNLCGRLGSERKNSPSERNIEKIDGKLYGFSTEIIWNTRSCLLPITWLWVYMHGWCRVCSLYVFIYSQHHQRATTKPAAVAASTSSVSEWVSVYIF